jgi:HD-GYP domain-containing protein (c-di-GMP phosphodiesterase class II)
MISEIASSKFYSLEKCGRFLRFRISLEILKAAIYFLCNTNTQIKGIVRMFGRSGTYFIILSSLLFVNIFSFLQGWLLDVTRPLDSYFMPTVIGIVLGVFVAGFIYANIKRNEEEKGFLEELVWSLSVSLDERDKYTSGHAARVTDLSVKLATQLDLDADSINAINL